MWQWIHRLGAPERCYRLCQRLAPIFFVVFALSFLVGIFWCLFATPADYQQGDAYRIMYLHVPAAVLSMGLYLAMCVAVVVYFIWRIQVADWLAQVLAPLGAIMAALTLITGSLWGRPTWGTYWIWDARLTSELLLLFVYLGVISLRRMMPSPDLAARASGLVACVGLINLPIIHYSVVWWHTLHQGSSILRFAKPAIVPQMLHPLLCMLLAYIAFSAWVAVINLSRKILQHKGDARWVLQLLEK